MHQPIPSLIPFDDFEVASRAVLAYLYQRLRFGLWMMTRAEGGDWIVLQAEDHFYNVKEGAVFGWADSFCSQMVQGRGPRVAPCAQAIATYAAAPIGQQVPIGAYIGVPLMMADGSLFGTLCAIDPQPQSESIRDELPTVELLARLLGTVLSCDLKALEQARLLERTQRQALTDGLTGLLNRQGWEQSIVTEEERARRYGSPTCALIVDLDGLKQVNDSSGHAAGDALIRRASDSIRASLRLNDIVARIGGDEFGIIGIECDAAAAEALQDKITKALASAGVRASVGKAMRDPGLGLVAAIAAADRAMYAEKAQHRMLAGR